MLLHFECKRLSGDIHSKSRVDRRHRTPCRECAVDDGTDDLGDGTSGAHRVLGRERSAHVTLSVVEGWAMDPKTSIGNVDE
jgi:hypothetical protein